MVGRPACTLDSACTRTARSLRCTGGCKLLGLLCCPIVSYPFAIRLLDPFSQALGDVDELNSWLGLAREHVEPQDATLATQVRPHHIVQRTAGSIMRVWDCLLESGQHEVRALVHGAIARFSSATHPA